MGHQEIKGGLQTVAVAIDLLDCFAEDEELGVTEVSQRLGIGKSSAHRMLVTLTAKGLLEQSQRSGKYRLGLHLWELGNLALTRQQLRQGARQMLEELREATGWTVQLSVSTGVDSLVIERLQTVRSMKALPEFNRRMPLNATAHGKAMCAFDPELARRRIEAGLVAKTPRTITKVAEFERELEEIRRRGYAIAVEEAVGGVASVAAPVLDVRGSAIAAISLNGAPSEITPSLERLGRLVQAACKRLSRDARVRQHD